MGQAYNNYGNNEKGSEDPIFVRAQNTSQDNACQ